MMAPLAPSAPRAPGAPGVAAAPAAPRAPEAPNADEDDTKTMQRSRGRRRQARSEPGIEDLLEGFQGLFSMFNGSAPGSPSAPRAPGAADATPVPAAPAASEAPSAAPAPSAPAASSAPAAPKAAGNDAKEGERLSGKHWQEVANKKWPASSRIEDLNDEFRPKAQAFIAMLKDNRIEVAVSSTLRPAELAYLYHYCLEVAGGRMKAADVPRLATVDIEWDHGDADKSKSAAKEMADAFGLVGVAAYPSNHSGGTALDMKMDFRGNTRDGKTAITYKVSPTDTDAVMRDLKVSDEAVVGVSARGKTIADIGSRALSQAGKDFGVIRAINNDIVHWSQNGR